MRATTSEGKVAKARAILAMEEAAGYVDCRDDAIELMHSLVRDVAGIEAHGLGADAARLLPLEKREMAPIIMSLLPAPTAAIRLNRIARLMLKRLISRSAFSQNSDNTGSGNCKHRSRK